MRSSWRNKRGHTDLGLIVAMGLTLVASGCFGQEDEVTSGGVSCPAAATGTPWVPDVTGTGDANHDDPAVDVQKAVFTQSGVTMLGVLDSFDNTTNVGSQFATFTFSIPEDLLESGSASLVAESINLDSRLTSGGVFAAPVLISLHDGVRELVNVQGCGSSFLDCTGSCTMRASCGPALASAFPGVSLEARQNKWSFQQGILNDTSTSVNVFPTCSWTSGSPSCELNGLLAASPASPGPGRLRAGTYTAKYVLLTNLYNIGSFSGRKTADVRLTVVRKKDANGGTARGAVDVNVILVGSRNIEDSRTDKGKQNLNEMLKHVHRHYSSSTADSNVGIKLGKITVYEWDCANGGDAYASLSLSAMRDFLSEGSQLVASESEGKALNIFLTRSIGGSTSGILGIAGGIPGAPLNGTPMSGLVFASFDRLATLNPACDGLAPCPTAKQQSFFVEMGATMSHEMGHYLGLFHISEGNSIASAPGTEPEHDPLPDTPACNKTAISGGRNFLTIASCLADTSVMQGLPVAAPYDSATTCASSCNAAVAAGSSPPLATRDSSRIDGFCPAAVECEFNHVMWWTTKGFVADGVSSGGDGNVFSPSAATTLNLSSFVR